MTTAAPTRLGRYRLEDLLGKGGMAEVYRATDTRLGRSVAIKMILPGFASKPTFVERFLREARTVASLDHPHILPIYDFGEQDGVPYLVMPHIRGGTLGERIGETGLPAQAAADGLAQLAGAIDAAHASGILHRDIKPGNVLIGDHDRLVVADFGLARAHGSATQLTTTGILVGTPLYMAPELAEGHEATPASDRYALGVLAYQMISGHPPFEAESPIAVLHRHVSHQVPSLSARVPGLPAAVDRFFDRALAKSPQDRPNCCAELAREFAAALADRTIGPPPARVPLATAAPVRRAEPGDIGETTSSPASRSRGTVLGARLGLATLALLGLVVAIGWARSRTDATPPMTPMAIEPALAVDDAKDATSIEPAAPPPTGTAAVESRPPVSPVAEDEDPIPEVSTGPTLASGLSLRGLFQQLRRPTRLTRLTRGDFDRIAAAVRGAQRSARPDSNLSVLAAYAAGGQSYADGDDAGARAAVDRARSAMSGRGKAGQTPAWLIGPSDASSLRDWELALLFGDARGEARRSIEAGLAARPQDGALRMARAVLDHMDGRHEQAIAGARSLLDQVGDRNRDGVGTVAVFLGDELTEVGRRAEAVDAYRRACDAGVEAACRLGGATRPVRRPRRR